MRLSVALAIVYLLAPGHPLSLLPGVPLNPLGLSAVIGIGLVCFGFWPRNPDARARRTVSIVTVTFGALIFAKIALWVATPSYGLPAWYFASGRFQGEPERSSQYPRAPFTRLDAELHFGGDELPVFFLNDVQRFNFFGAEGERRRNLPFSVRWQGALYAPRDDVFRFWLTASGPATLSLDGRQIAEVDADGRDTRLVEVPLSEGSHEVRVSYARRPPRSPDLKVDWDPGGERQPLAVPYLTAAPRLTEQWQRDGVLRGVAFGLDGLVLAGLTGLAAVLIYGRFRRVENSARDRFSLLERPLLAAFLAAVYVHAAVPELDRVGKMALLGGGQDWLTHESFARDILLNGPLMTLGKPLGEGRTYYAQPFYPYALAAMHWLAGEDQFGPTVLQLFGLGVAGMLLYFIAARLFGRAAGVATLGVFVGLRAWQLDWVARRLLSENVYFVVLPATLLFLLRYLDQRRRADLILAGVMLGLAIVTRGPTLLYLPLAVLLVAVALRRDGASHSRVRGAAAGLMAIALAITLLVPLRNWVVAGQPALVASSGGANLEKFHRPTSGVRLAEANRRWYAPYIQDVPTREVLEFIQQDPLGYAATYLPLALYTLGYGAALEESHVVVWPDLVALNALYLAVVLFSARARSPRAAILHAFIAVHFGTMVVFAPYDYDNRLVLPMYLPMTVFAGFAFVSALHWMVARLKSPAAATDMLAVGPAAQGEAGSAAIIRRP